MSFDHNKPYGVIQGDDKGRYEQDGCVYDEDYNHISGEQQARNARKPGRPPLNKEDSSAGQLSMTSVEDQLSKQVA